MRILKSEGGEFSRIEFLETGTIISGHHFSLLMRNWLSLYLVSPAFALTEP